MKWACGIVTIPKRKELFDITVSQIARAGFSEPHVFTDDNLGTAGRWFLSLWELYMRNPQADLYAMFQDDFVCGLNVREYLEHTCTQENVYWNLYTHRENAPLAKSDGWFRANQLGKGAVALVFPRKAVKALLTSEYMFDRFVPSERNMDRHRKAIDGGIVSALKKFGFEEWCHYPSLVQHTGVQSTMGNAPNQTSPCFAGVEVDCLDWVNRPL